MDRPCAGRPVSAQKLASRGFSRTRGAESAGMIQCDVGQKESVEIADAQTVNGQLFAEMGIVDEGPGSLMRQHPGTQQG